MGRLAIMSLLSMFLMVPMTMVDSMVREQSDRRDDAVSEVGASWGGRQTISGPVLVVPYPRHGRMTRGGSRARPVRPIFLPSELRVDAVVTTQPRSRGIFDVVVYTTTVKVEGTFLRPALDWLRPVPTDVRWGDATVTVGISDPKALTRRASLVMPASGDTAPFAGGMVDVGLFNAGVRAPVRGLNAIRPGLPFHSRSPWSCTARGTFDSFLRRRNLGQGVVRIPHASFVGARLPEPRTTGAAGFTAEWHVPDFGRPFPSRWIGDESNRAKLATQAEASTFGVSLSRPVDIYQQSDRAVKYPLLFIVLTFLVFFMWEFFRFVLLHPMQYRLRGVRALCLLPVAALALGTFRLRPRVRHFSGGHDAADLGVAGRC